MARLTRTQKYAELREKIVHDREASLKTESLTQYEDKLKKIENYFNVDSDIDLDKRGEVKIVVEKPQVDAKQFQEEKTISFDDFLDSMMNSTYSNDFVLEKVVETVEPVETVNPIVEEGPVETAKPVEVACQEVDVKRFQEESMKSLDDILDSMMNSTYSNESVEEKIVETVEPVETVNPIVEEESDETDNPIVEEEPVEINKLNEEKKYVSSTNNMPIMEIIKDEVKELSDIIGPTRLVIEEKEEKKPVDLISITENVVEKLSEESELKNTAPQTNSFIKDILKEVDDYNRSEGRTTLDKLPDTIVDEVRHPQGVQKAEEEIRNDNEFSNTVTLEIEKVLNEIKNQGNKIDVPVGDAVANAEAEFESDEAFKNAEVKEEINEHPVLAKTVEEPIVEIKNIAETLSNTFTDANVLDDTIPFVLEKSEVEEEEYEEDEAPSRVLNVILGVLIFVLVAVLGIIVYYILIAKGIIG